jgi:hypothetical protein
MVQDGAVLRSPDARPKYVCSRQPQLGYIGARRVLSRTQAVVGGRTNVPPNPTCGQRPQKTPNAIVPPVFPQKQCDLQGSLEISGDGGNRTHVRDRVKDGFYERSRRSDLIPH